MNEQHAKGTDPRNNLGTLQPTNAEAHRPLSKRKLVFQNKSAYFRFRWGKGTKSTNTFL